MCEEAPESNTHGSAGSAGVGGDKVTVLKALANDVSSHGSQLEGPD